MPQKQDYRNFVGQKLIDSGIEYLANEQTYHF
jgi:hypothetical protein